MALSAKPKVIFGCKRDSASFGNATPHAQFPLPTVLTHVCCLTACLIRTRAKPHTQLSLPIVLSCVFIDCMPHTPLDCIFNHQDESQALQLLPWDSRSPLSVAAAILYMGMCIKAKVNLQSKQVMYVYQACASNQQGGLFVCLLLSCV